MSKLTALADDIWVFAAPHQFLGMAFGTRTTVVRLGDGGLWVHNPGPIDDALVSELGALGEVRDLLGPNLFHHMYLADWKAAFPGARLHGAPGLADKRKDLSFDATLGGELDPSWGPVLDHCPLDGQTMLAETFYLHGDSRTLITADGLLNIQVKGDWKRNLYMWLNGAQGVPKVPMAVRMAFRDKAASRRALDRCLAWEFDRIVISHGEVVHQDGNDVLREAYAWLKG